MPRLLTGKVDPKRVCKNKAGKHKAHPGKTEKSVSSFAGDSKAGKPGGKLKRKFLQTARGKESSIPLRQPRGKRESDKKITQGATKSENTSRVLGEGCSSAGEWVISPGDRAHNTLIKEKDRFVSWKKD